MWNSFPYSSCGSDLQLWSTTSTLHNPPGRIPPAVLTPATLQHFIKGLNTQVLGSAERSDQATNARFVGFLIYGMGTQTLHCPLHENTQTSRWEDLCLILYFGGKDPITWLCWDGLARSQQDFTLSRYEWGKIRKCLTTMSKSIVNCKHTIT